MWSVCVCPSITLSWFLCLVGDDPDEDPEDPYTQINDSIRGMSYLP